MTDDQKYDPPVGQEIADMVLENLKGLLLPPVQWKRGKHLMIGFVPVCQFRAPTAVLVTPLHPRPVETPARGRGGTQD